MHQLPDKPRTPTNPVGPLLACTHDISGYEIFNQGETGAAHALAHRLSDDGLAGLGNRLLGRWLEGRSGQGSEWVHLHFHKAIFELEVGDWHEAHARFLTEVLPAAATTADALTDAPALAWRIAMAAPESVSLPWEPLRRTALSHMQRRDKPFVQVHHLLALAGAGDSGNIVRWLQSAEGASGSQLEPVVAAFAQVLISLVAGDLREAAFRLQLLLPDLSSIGGSRAQQQLFDQLATWLSRRGQGAPANRIYRDAA